MPLLAGTRLGPYEIVAAIGAGGMGEVYRARDSRLQRDVAVKVLPGEFALDVDRRARFERETQAVAALSHPNILTIFDVGIDGDVAYAVTELLDGETLRARLTHGPLPLRKSIEAATQIARGLAAAHDRSIVHRDLKPENVFLVADGRVKILDFGLARTEVAVAAGATVTVAAATDPGTVLGTVGYMSPEQVRARPVDARTDIFSFGAVLYEMLTGARAFQHDTAAETMTAILREDPPDLADARRDVSPALERIVRHCLEKNPAERFRSADDVAFALDAIAGSKAASGQAMAIPPRRRWQPLAVGVVLAVAGIVGGAIVARRLGAKEAAPITFEVKTFDPQWITNARFAADGQTIFFSAALSGNTPQLFVLRKDTIAPQPLGPPATHLLAVSSKNELAVITEAKGTGHRLFEGTLSRMTMDSAPRAWMQHVREADWSPDGSVLAVIRNENGRDQLEYPVGTMLRQTTGYMSDLRVSPDGSRVAFFDHPIVKDDRGSVKVVDREAHVTDLSPVYQGLETLAWSPDGRSILYAGATPRGNMPFIVEAGGSTPPRVAFPSADPIYVHDVAADGRTLVTREDMHQTIRARLPGESTEREYPWLDFPYFGRLSSDGQRLFFSDEGQYAGENYAVVVRGTRDNSPVVKLGDGSMESLSPDGKWAVALLPATEQLVLYPLGPGESKKLPRGPIERYRIDTMSWTPDGGSVLFCGNEAGRPLRAYRQHVSGGLPAPISPDNVQMIVPTADAGALLEQTTSGEFQIQTLGTNSIRPAHGLTPTDIVLAWSRDGKSVFVQSGVTAPAQIERVDVATGSRTRVAWLAPPDLAGVNALWGIQWLNDGAAYTYTYGRQLSKLFVASGVRMTR